MMNLSVLRSRPVGVVGLGLMGNSIVVALLASGYRVIALAPVPGEKDKAAEHLVDLLRHAAEAGMLSRGIDACVDALRLVEDYQQLQNCRLVLECVIEDKTIKKAVYNRITEVVSDETIIASNTSAIPISELQTLVSRPERFLGVHWAEPAYMTRFLEVTCGQHTNPAIAHLLVALGETWGKEPTLLLKDIRGFITNRLMYAVYREALSLVEEGQTTLLDADKVFRYDAGSWITLMGIFQRMAFLGIEDTRDAYNRLIPRLSNRQDVPEVMQQMVSGNARGIHNRTGLYPYTETSAARWEEAFARFNRDIYELASRYRTLHIANKKTVHAY